MPEVVSPGVNIGFFAIYTLPFAFNNCWHGQLTLLLSTSKEMFSPVREILSQIKPPDGVEKNTLLRNNGECIEALQTLSMWCTPIAIMTSRLLYGGVFKLCLIQLTPRHLHSCT
jgi:hypothetical protein